MKKSRIYRYLAGTRGEGNAKFIATLSIITIVGYTIYSILPVYYKEQQLNHDVKEEARQGAVNGAEPKKVEKRVKDIVDNINFPTPIKIDVIKKGDNLTIKCTGTIPVSFVVYTYNYNVNVEQTANRGGY
jgi:hypothetical protein